MSEKYRLIKHNENLAEIGNDSGVGLLFLVDEDCERKLEIIVNLLNKQQTTISQLKEENEQLKIANARWLDKSLQDKQTRYINANYQELTKKYLQLKEENEQLKEKNEKLQWELGKTREDLDYFANLKVSAMRGSDCEHDRCYVTSMQKKGDGT